MAPRCPKMVQDGPKMAPRWPPDGPKMAPRWPKIVQENIKRPILVHHGAANSQNMHFPFVFSMIFDSPLGAILDYLGSSWDELGAIWGPSWGHLGAQDGPMMAPRWPPDGPKMAPRWTRKSKKARRGPFWFIMRRPTTKICIFPCVFDEIGRAHV